MLPIAFPPHLRRSSPKVLRDGEANRHRVGRLYLLNNTGVIAIDWGRADPAIALHIRDEQGGLVMEENLSLSSLQRP